jgi:hypothetical protein
MSACGEGGEAAQAPSDKATPMAARVRMKVDIMSPKNETNKSACDARASLPRQSWRQWERAPHFPAVGR